MCKLLTVLEVCILKIGDHCHIMKQTQHRYAIRNVNDYTLIEVKSSSIKVFVLKNIFFNHG
jgi:hypothetical protein